MKTFSESLARFAGSVPSSSPAPGPLGVSAELAQWFSLVELPVVVPWYGDGLELHSHEGLADAQLGYRASVDGTPTPDWKGHWVVIGNVSADPVIADVSEPSTPILCAVHGIGAWSPEPLAPSVRDFARALAVWLAVVGDTRPHETDELRPEVADAIHARILPIVGATAGRLWLGRRWIE